MQRATDHPASSPQRGSPLLLLAFFFALLAIVAFVFGPALFTHATAYPGFVLGWLVSMGLMLATALCLLAESVTRARRARSR